MRTLLLLLLAIGLGSISAANTAFADGACCLGDASCIDTNLAGCDQGSGDFQGEGTTCDTTVCLGACCLEEEACAEDSSDGCEAAAGTFQGPNTTCERHCPAKLSTVFTYQGQLKQAGVPLSGSADLAFSLWTSTKGGDQVGDTLFVENVPVSGGLLSVPLDFGIDVFNGNARWLEIAVRSPHDPGENELLTTLSPRQLITGTPYALQTRGLFVDEPGNVGIGTVTPTESLHVSGNVQVDGWIGTGNDQPVHVFVNDTRALRIEYAEFKRFEQDVFAPSPNMIGGSPSNTVADGVAGATISGGGFDDGTAFGILPNRVISDFGTVGGGQDNEAGDEAGLARFATVSGGHQNSALGISSSVGGGFFNKATERYSTVPGGYGNVAGGHYSFAAGRRARVRDATEVEEGEICTFLGTCGDEGTFVWADTGVDFNGTEFLSTGPNQFLIRAAGGVGIGTNSPQSQLDVLGAIRSGGASGGVFSAINPDNQASAVSLSWLNNVARIRVGGSGAGSKNGLDIQRQGDASIMRLLDNGNVGIGTTIPSNPLTVVRAGTESGGISGFGEVIARVRNTTAGTHTALSVDAATGRDAILYLAEDGSAQWDLRSDASSGGFQIRHQAGGANTTRMVIAADGDVGIGTTSPAAGFKLDVAGNIRCAALTETSSRSLKENITPIEGALDMVARLQGVRFNWTAEHGGKPDLGFVAEDVAKVLPELVTWEEEGRQASGLKYGHITAVAVEAIKELRRAVDAKDAEIASQRVAVEQLRHENGAIKTRLAKLEAVLSNTASARTGGTR